MGKNGEKDGGEKSLKEERKEGKDNREKKIEGRKKGGNWWKGERVEVVRKGWKDERMDGRIKKGKDGGKKERR